MTPFRSLPESFGSACGVESDAAGVLQDCQGKSLSTPGCRTIAFCLIDETGAQIVLRETGYISKSVSNPILSFGKFIRKGW